MRNRRAIGILATLIITALALAFGLAPSPASADDTIRINFQHLDSKTPKGYVADVGLSFGPRTGGHVYGWSRDHRGTALERHRHADQRLDTLVRFRGDATWEIALDPGEYEVTVAIGDPRRAGRYTINVEGQPFWDGLVLGAGTFRSLTEVIAVSDGRLTLDAGRAPNKQSRILYLEIAPLRVRPLPPRDIRPQPQNCTYTQGFWKNHPSVWPVGSLQLGGTTYSQSQLLAILRTPPRGDATYILAHQLIAARLNVAQGADPAAIAATLVAADAWLRAHPLGSNPRRDARREGIGYAVTLDLYNNGVIGPGHCDDARPTPTPEPPTPTPTPERPTRTPTVEPPTRTPTVEPPTRTPTPERPTRTPTVEPPTRTPTVEPPTRTPTPERPTRTPTVEPPTRTPTVEPPSPTVAPPSPTVAPPSPTVAPPTATATRTGPICPPDPIDFGVDARGNPLPAGTWIDDEWAPYGVHISGTGRSGAPDQVILFDSANPTGGDPDLGAPNQDFGGPGIGAGGGAGMPGENRFPQGMLLVLAQDLVGGDPVTDPSDSFYGGDIWFNFDQPYFVERLEMLDVDTTETANRVDLYDLAGNLIRSEPFRPLGNNSYQEIVFNQGNVGAIHVVFTRSAGLTGVIYCDEVPPTPTPTPTETPPPTPTRTPEPTATATNTPEPTATNTPEPTATNTPEPEPTPEPPTPTTTATLEPSPTPTETGAICPPDPIDFGVDARGNPLPAGTWIDDEWALLGIHISGIGRRGAPDQVILFDSANPTGGDPDLGAPNQDFGGPGIGAGGGAGMPGENRFPQGMLLVLAQDLVGGDPVTDPSDSFYGGDIWFNFDQPYFVERLEMLDVDTTETANRVDLYDLAGNLIRSEPFRPLGNNSYQEIVFNQGNVGAIHVFMSSSAGLTGVIRCEEVPPVSPTPTGTPRPTRTPTPTSTLTPVLPTPTRTSTPTATPTSVPTVTPTGTPLPTPTFTPTSVPPTPTSTPTNTPVPPTPTFTPTSVPPTPTSTPTSTPVPPTPTSTPTSTPVPPTPTSTPTNTPVPPTPTNTPTNTPVPPTPTRTPSPTPGVCVPTGLDIYYILDASASMDQSFTGGTLTKLDAAKQAIRDTNDVIDGWNNGSRVGLISFTSDTSGQGQVFVDVTNWQSLTTNTGAVDSALNLISAVGGTPTSHALRIALDEMVADRAPPNNVNVPVFIVLSDGLPTVGWEGDPFFGNRFVPGDVALVDVKDAMGNFRPIADIRADGVFYPQFNEFSGEPLADLMESANFLKSPSGLPSADIHAIAVQGQPTNIFNADVLEYVAQVGTGVFASPNDLTQLQLALEAAIDDSACNP